MTVLSAQSIRLIKPVSPFVERTKEFGLSYGLSAAGYDVRIAEEMTLWPGAFALASTVELFDMPRKVIAFVKDKSTWARQGLCVQNTVIEPGWRGYLTLELTNHGSSNLRLSPGMPIAQIVFQWLDEETEQPYEGKYQDQRAGAVAAILEPYIPNLLSDTLTESFVDHHVTDNDYA